VAEEAIDSFNEFERTGWEHQAATYGQFFGPITGRLVGPLLDAAAAGPGSRVLDLATGPGYVAAGAHERGAAVIGVDFAPAMIGLARRLHPAIDFRQADAEALPFDDRSFDAVVSNFVVPHLGRPELVVGELVRVLDDGGRLALTTWDGPERMRLLGVFLDAFTEAGAAAPDDLPVGPPFFRFASDEEFTRLLEGGGLTGVEVRAISFSHRLASADELWNGMLTATVRTSALLLGQPEPIRQRIREAFDRRVLEYGGGDGFELPVAVKLALGHKPPRPG
jgi:SAM-dependent methyltransferase